MASPFSVFRKNQKLLMAIACLLAIVAFVFLPMIGQNLEERPGGPVNAVVVKTTQFGDLKESDVHNLLLEHRRILDVLTNIAQLSGVYPYPAMANQMAKNFFLSPTEENVVNTWLLANHAKQMGMVVSDDAINAFLKLWTQDSVKSADLAAALKRSGFTVLQFFNLMRDELMARQVREMFMSSLGGITPAERWGYFTRIKKMASIEAVAVEVAGFVQRIEDPTDQELKAFFEANKDQYAFPGASEPGFHQPQKIALQWFKVNQDKVLAAVTDEEIKERYEKNKDVYDQMEKKLEEEKAKALKEKEEKTSTKDAKATKTVEEVEKKDAEKKEDKKELKETPTDKKPEKKDEAKGSSSVDRKSPFRFAAMMQEEKPAKNAEAKDQPKATEAKPSEQPKTPAAQDKAAETPKTPATPEKKAEESPKAPMTQEKPVEEKHGMSDATKKRIRQEIAQEKLSKIFDGLREKMDLFRNEWSKYEVAMIQAKNKKEGEQKTMPTPPAKLDFEKLAKENGLSTGQTDLMSQWQVQSQSIGMSLAGGRSPVYAYAFQSLAKFHPETSIDMLGDVYLFWKTDETKDLVPKFEDKGVRNEVLRAWKMIQARSLAMKEAESIAAEARKTRKTLKETLADRPGMPIIMPPPFSWMTFGNVPMGSAPNAARNSDVVGVAYAGDDFMRTVFRLEPSQIGTAFNEPKTVAYVIQLDEFTPSHKVLWKEFEVDDFSKYEPAAREDQRQAYQAWLDEIKTSAGLKWERKADQTQESGSREE